MRLSPISLAVILILLVGCKAADISINEEAASGDEPQQIRIDDSLEEAAFVEASEGEWQEVFFDSCEADWTDQWFLDGEIATVTYQMTIIKTDRVIYMKAASEETTRYFKLTNEKYPIITEGRIGLRQMSTRSARYRDFKVSVPQ